MYSLALVFLAAITTALLTKRSRQAFPSVSLQSSSLPTSTSAGFPATSDVTSISSFNWTTVNCKNSSIQDASVPAFIRWANADTNMSWEAALKAWHDLKPEDNQVKLTFPAFISRFYNGPEDWDCQDIVNTACSMPVQCTDVKYPAGYLILNSFAKLHNLYQSYHEALQDAQQSLSTQMSAFTSTFSFKFGQKTMQQLLKMILDVFQISYAVVSGVTWNIAFMGASVFKAYENKIFAKDNVNGFMVGSLVFTKDVLSLATEDLRMQNNIVAGMGLLFEALRQAQADWIDEVFSGNHTGLQHLELVLRDGLMEQVPANIDFRQITVNLEKTILGQLIPIAWAISPNSYYPFILKTGEACSDILPKTLNVFMEQDTHDKSGVCWRGNQFYVLTVNTYGVDVQYTTAKLPDSRPPFATLMGATHDVLNGTKWGGITLTDIVVSSVRGYQKNGYRNGYSLSDSDDDGSPADQVKFSGGVRTPGFFSLPVCTNLWNTLMNIAGVRSDDPEYPCKTFVEKVMIKT